MSGRISRRTFLKLLGFGTVALGVGGFLRFGSTGDLRRLLLPFPSASAQSAGSWSQGPDTTTVAIHAALLPSGKIFYLAGSGYHSGHQDGPFEARIRDLSTGSEQSLTQSRDSWCAGQCGLPNGNILFAGGTLMYDTNINNCNGAWHGVNAGYEVDENSGSPLSEVASMAQGRWYPTCVTLPDGKVLVVNGFDEFGTFNLLAEIYDPISKSWTISYDPSNGNTYCAGAGQAACAGAGSPCYGSSNHGVAPNTGLYPRMHLMPSGLVITAGQSVTVRSWDPATGIWNIITQTSSYRDYGTTILLPLQNTSTERGKILIVGGDVTASDPALRTVEIVDFNAGTSTNPVVRNVASLNTGRKYLLPIILPTGKCVVFGGFDPGPGVYTNTPEMFDPVTETWTNLPAATVPRGYHGVALLLPDGRVWTAGATPNVSIWELRTEIFSPAYYFQTRPTISGNPTVGDYGGTIVIPTPDGPNISSVSLVRLGATTHHYDANARLIWLQIVNSSSGSVTVSAPINARLAPPGYYMIFILNGSQVPSVARIIKIPGTASGPTLPAKVAGLTVTPISTSQLNLSWTANSPVPNNYNVYRGTTAGFPVNTANDTPLTQVAGSTTTFSNTGLTASTTYYYRVAAVNASGIGTPSDEASATTSGALPAKVAGLTVTPISTSQLNLSWTANSPVPNNYNVYRGTTAGFPVNTATDTPLTQVAGSTTTFSNTGLTASTTYYYRVAAVNASGIGTPSDEASATTSGGVTEVIFYNVAIPGNSAGILGSGGSAVRYGEEANTASSILVGKALKNWKVRLRKVGNPSGPVVARIRRRSDDAVVATFDQTIDSTTLPAAFAEFTFTLTNPYTIQTGDRILIEYNGPNSVRLESWNVNMIDGTNTRRTRYDGTTYVRSDTEDITGTMSSVTGGPTLPAKVAGLTVTPISTSQLNLSWTANSPVPNNYNVYRGTTAGFPVNTATDTPLTQVAGSTTTFSNTGLTASTTYYYRVAAVNASGIGTPSDEASATTSGALPAKVADLTVTPISTSQLDLNWTANSPVPNNYNVYRGTTAGFPVNTATDTPLTQVAGSTTTFSNTGLTASTTYYYRVAAVNASGIGTPSDEASATTSGALPAKVADLTVTPISTSQLDLNWTANSPVPNNYNVYRGTTAGFPVNTATDTPLTQVAGSTTTFSNTGLTASTTYYYRVAAVNASGIGTPSDEASATTSGALPAKVADLTVTPISTSQLDLNWTANSPVPNNYNVYRGTTAGFPVNTATDTPLTQVAGSTTTFSNTGLTASTTYYYRVAAVNASGIGTPSDEASATTSGALPAKVADLTVTPISTSQLDLNWTANSPVPNNYNVYRGTTAGFPVNTATDTPLTQVAGSTTTFSNTGLTASTTYYYRVAAVNASGIGTPSDEASATTSGALPAKVADLTVTPISTSQLDLNWTANSPVPNNYNVYRGTTAGFPVNTATDTPLTQVAGSTTTFSNTGLTASTTYYYRVAAVNASGIGTPSDEASATTSGALPAKVAGLTVTPISTSQLDLNWTANSPVPNNYNVYRGTTAGFPVNTATDTPLTQVAGSTTTFSNTGLTASTTYYYRVAAVNASGIGTPSDEASATTSGALPAKVADLTVTPISTSQLDLNWTANSPVPNNYNVYRGTTAGFPVNTATDTPLTQVAGSTTTFSNTGLTASTTYYYRVAAVNASGIGTPSDEASATTSGGLVFYNVAIPGNSAGIIGAGGTALRYGEEANTASSILVGKALKNWKVRLRKVGAPSGPVVARIRRRSDDAVVATFNQTIDSTTLPTAYAEFTFTLTNPYTIQTGDRILIEYSGPQSVRLESWNVNVIDGINTRRTRYDGTTYVRSDTEDITGTMSDG